MKRAKKLGARTVMNFAPASQPLSDEAFRNIDFLVVNEHEVAAVAKAQSLAQAEPAAWAKELHARFGAVVIVTLGPQGAICVSDKGLSSLPPLKIDPVDTVGAGDAFIRYLAAALEEALPLEEALQRAIIAGSLACTKVGGQSAFPEEREVRAHLAQMQVSAV